MDEKQRYGIAQKDFNAYKKIMAQLSIPRFAVEGDEFEIVGQSINYTQDSFLVKTAFVFDNNILGINDEWLNNSFTEYAKIIVPEEKDSLELTYKLTMGDYYDGEKRKLKINKQGTIESKGEFRVLKNNDKFNYTATLDAAIKVSVQNNKLDVLLESLDYLKDYEFGCNEQTASRLIALLLEKELRKRLGEKFNGERKILKAIRLLEKRQNKYGTWGWWDEDVDVNWITLYVLEALQMAENSGYEISFLDKALNLIAQRNHNFKTADQLKAIHILLNDGTAVDSTEIMKNDTIDLSVSEFLLWNKIKQKSGYTVDYDSIKNLLVKSTYGGMHISSENKYWYYDNVNATLLAYDIFKENGDGKITDAIELFLYKNRTHQGWNNTIHSANILKRILPDENEISTSSFISIEGKEIKDFPYVMEFDKNNISITHSGSSPHFVSVYQDGHIRNPKERKDVFEVESYFMQGDKKVDELKKSTPAKMVVKVNAKEEGDYIKIEIPIPSACSYAGKKQYHGIETHREYHKDKVLIFCSRLPKGENIFTIDLEPRYTGKYILNPAKVEEMYAPNIFGRNGIGKLNVN